MFLHLKLFHNFLRRIETGTLRIKNLVFKSTLRFSFFIKVPQPTKLLGGMQFGVQRTHGFVSEKTKEFIESEID